MKPYFSDMNIGLVVTAISFLVFVGLAVGDGSVGSSEKVTHKLSEFELGRYQYCGSDADCIVAQNGCCDCANGGEDVAVNKQQLAAFKSRFDCLEVACTMMAAVPPCGDGLVSCINHKCQYMKRQ